MAGSVLLIVCERGEPRASLKAVFTGSPHHLVFASNGEEALERLSEVKPHVVLVDQSAQRLGAVELCRRMRRLPDGQRVGLLLMGSVLPQAGLQSAAEACRADGVLTFPAEPSVLVGRLALLLAFGPRALAARDAAQRAQAEAGARNATDASEADAVLGGVEGVSDPRDNDLEPAMVLREASFIAAERIVEVPHIAGDISATHEPRPSTPPMLAPSALTPLDEEGRSATNEEPVATLESGDGMDPLAPVETIESSETTGQFELLASPEPLEPLAPLEPLESLESSETTGQFELLEPLEPIEPIERTGEVTSLDSHAETTGLYEGDPLDRGEEQGLSPPLEAGREGARDWAEPSRAGLGALAPVDTEILASVKPLETIELPGIRLDEALDQAIEHARTQLELVDGLRADLDFSPTPLLELSVSDEIPPASESWSGEGRGHPKVVPASGGGDPLNDALSLSGESETLGSSARVPAVIGYSDSADALAPQIDELSSSTEDLGLDPGALGHVDTVERARSTERIDVLEEPISHVANHAPSEGPTQVAFRDFSALSDDSSNAPSDSGLEPDVRGLRDVDAELDALMASDVASTTSESSRVIGDGLDSALDDSLLGKGYARRIEQMYALVDGGADYYRVLGVPQDFSPEGLRSAYFDLSLELHPDRFVMLQSGELKEKLFVVYRRITEAYDELSEPRRRRAYDEDLARRRSASEPALESTRAQPRVPGAAPQMNPVRGDARESISALEVIVRDDQAKKLVDFAVAAYAGADFNTARLFLHLAQAYEPENAQLTAASQKIARLSRPPEFVA